MLEIGTDYVLDNEPCYNLSELNLMSPQSKLRRYRVYIVIRGDRMAKHMEDLGPAKMFHSDEFRIPGGVVNEVSKRIDIEHTVAELRDIADTLRESNGFNKRELVGKRAHSIHSNGN